MPILEESSVEEDECMLNFCIEGVPEDNSTIFIHSEGAETTSNVPKRNEETGNNNRMSPTIETLEGIKMQKNQNNNFLLEAFLFLVPK